MANGNELLYFGVYFGEEERNCHRSESKSSIGGRIAAAQLVNQSCGTSPNWVFIEVTSVQTERYSLFVEAWWD